MDEDSVHSIESTNHRQPDGQPLPQRPRINLPRPVEMNNSYQIGYRQGTNREDMIPENYNQVSVSDLMNAEYKKNRTILHAQLIRIVSASNDNSKSQSYSYYQRGSSKNNKTGTYTRMFLFRQHESPDVFYIIENEEARNLWTRSPELRDSGALTIGTFITIVNPEPIVKLIGNDAPIIKTGLPVVIRKAPTLFYDVPMHTVESNDTKAFTLTGVHFELKFISIKKSCSGYLCDRQILDAKQKCGCYTLLNRSANAVCQLDILVKDNNDNDIFFAQDFSSYQFMSLFLVNGKFPTTVQVPTLQKFTITDNMTDVFDDCFNYINNNGGFTIFGWYKRGEVNDQGNTENEQVNVDSGNLGIHMVHAIPARPLSRLNFEHLKYNHQGLV